MSQPTATFAAAPATIRLGDLEVPRLGFGAMRLPGKDAFGEPADPAAARAVVRRAVELGIGLIDSSWYYGPHVAHRIIAEAIHPYPAHVVIATKLGGMRFPDGAWGPFARPDQLREGLEHDLRGLRRERIDIVHLRYIGRSGVPFLESLDALIGLQREGKIRHLALSNVNAGQVRQAVERTPIVSVQNHFNIAGGASDLAKRTYSEVDDPPAVLAACEELGIAFLPFFPLGIGAYGASHPALADAMRAHGATAAQISLAWLLARSRVMLPIPGTSSVAHLEENWAARNVVLSVTEVERIARSATAAR